MSNIFGPLMRRGGVVNYTVANGPLVGGGYSAMGLNFDSDGRVQCSNGDPVTHHSNGIPFTEHGRVAVFGTGAPNYFNQGLGFYDNGRLAITGAGHDHYGQGNSYNVNSRMRVSTAAPP